MVGRRGGTKGEREKRQDKNGGVQPDGCARRETEYSVISGGKEEHRRALLTGYQERRRRRSFRGGTRPGSRMGIWLFITQDKASQGTGPVEADILE